MKKEKRARQKILIVDDSEMNRSLLAEMLGNEYEIIEAEDGAQAVVLLRKYRVEISLVLLDIVMPVMDGYGVLTVMKNKHWIEDIPVIMISAENSQTSIERAYEMGVTDFISRPFDALIVRRRVVNTIMLYTKQRRLAAMVADQIYEKEKNSDMMINILSHIVEFRNGESGLHILHVQNLTETLLNKLVKITDKYPLTPSEITLISTASALHDIGKISIPDEILNKPGRLTDEEFEIMKTHSMAGANVLSELSFYKDEPLVKYAYDICRWHHERYDGRGYPDGLKGDEIPISAQIVALADVYDALTSDRVYKKAFTHKKALDMILGGECGTFNPILLECLRESADVIRADKAMTVNDSLKNDTKRLKNLAAELGNHSELSASEHTLNQLEYERMKSNFFTGLSQNILFEYTADPSITVVTPYGAEKLGIEEITIHVEENEIAFPAISDDDLAILKHEILNTTPENPLAQFDCPIRFAGKWQKMRIICKAVWTNHGEQEITGVIGKVTFSSQQFSGVTKPEEHEQLLPHDALTGMLTYSFAKKFMQKLMETKKDTQFALAIVDIDGFKTANQTYGSDFGNELLIRLCEKLRRLSGRGDIVARVGGDEFVLFSEIDGDIEQSITALFSQFYDEDDPYSVSVSMGVAKADSGVADCSTVFSNANRALSCAKKKGRGSLAFYNDTMKDMVSAISPIDENEREVTV